MTRVSFVVYATPGPQGSKRHIGNGVMVESSKKVKPFRAAVVEAARDAIGEARAIASPVLLTAEFVFPRPAGHYGTGRNSAVLKASAPPYPTSRNLGDLSKLVRALEDALTDAGVWIDDSQVVAFPGTCKEWCHRGEPAHTNVTVQEITPEEDR